MKLKEDFEEDREGCLTHLSGFFKGSSNREKGKMPIMDGINKFRAYVKKLPRAPHPPVPSREVWLSLWGAFLGLGFTSLLAVLWKCPMLLGPFGASAVLIFGAYKAPLAQPRNVLMGHFLAACIGVCVNDFFGATFWSIALGVALALVLMVVTYSIHPRRCNCIRGSSDGWLGCGLYVYLESSHLGSIYSSGNWRDFQ